MRPLRCGVGLTLACALSIAAPCAAQTVVSKTGPESAIADNNTTGVSIPLEVSGLGDITDVDLRFDAPGTCNGTSGNSDAALTHNFVGDLVVSLISPDGTTVVAINRRGGDRNNICQLLLDDDSGAPGIGTVTSVNNQPLAGTYTPDAPFAAFDGKPAAGTWVLKITDLAANNTGTLHRFSLVLTTTPVQPIVVDVTDDPFPGGCAPNSCSLREAVLLANSHAGFDRIVLPASTQLQLTRAGIDDSNAAGDLDITEDLEIVGQGKTLTRLTQTAADRLFHIQGAGTDFTLRQMTVAGGGGVSQGGALVALNNARLVIDNVRFTDNTAIDQGGAIYHSGGSGTVLPRVVISDSEFDGNTAVGGVNSLGGAVASLSSGFNEDYFHIERSALSANSATDGAGALLLDGVQSVSGNTAVIRDTTFTANLAPQGKGGAIGSDVNGFGQGIVNLDVAGSVFDENQASNNAVGGGGAIATSGTLTVESSRFSSNQAYNGGAISAAFIDSLTRSTLCGNTAVVSGGAIAAAALALIERTTLCDNTVTTSDVGQAGGGGVYVSTTSFDMTIRRSTFDNNNALRGGALTASGGDLILQGNTFVAPTTVAPGTAGSVLRYVGSNAADNLNYNSNIFIGQCSYTAGIGPDTALNNIEASGNTCKLTTATVTGGNIVATAGNSINLAALADNGGPTRTRLPVAPSIAIGAGSTTGCVSPDQRGYPVTDNDCDTGAVEAGASPPSDTIFANGFE